MVWCAVVNCKNNNSKTKRGKDILQRKLKYFSFPKDEEIRKQWIIKCKRKKQFNTTHSRICSAHFTEEDFSLKYRLLDDSKIRCELRPDAVPSLNLPMTLKESEEDKRRKERMDDLMKKKLLHDLDKIMENKKRNTESLHGTNQIIDDSNSERSCLREDIKIQKQKNKNSLVDSNKKIDESREQSRLREKIKTQKRKMLNNDASITKHIKEINEMKERIKQIENYLKSNEK